LIRWVSFQCKWWVTFGCNLTFKTFEIATQDNIEAIFGIALDFDKGRSSFELVKEVVSDLDIEFLIHTTANYRADEPRLRVIIPYAEPLYGKDGHQLHKRSWVYFNKLVGPIDPAGKNPVQKWLFPKYGLEGEEFLWDEWEGGHRFDPLSDLEPESAEDKAPSRVASLLPNRGEFKYEGCDLDELYGLLSRIDPSCTYSEWFETIAASINAFGRTEGVIQALDSWSQESADKYNQDAFNKAVESVRDEHDNPAGIGKLRYLAGMSLLQNRAGEKISTADLEAIVEPQHHETALEIASTSYAQTARLLEQYGNELDEKHSRAIWSISEGLSYSALANGPIRVAYPLQTGMGKTSSFRGFVRGLLDRDEDIAIAYCAERIQELHDLKQLLIEEDGVPEREIGLLHSSSSKYRDIPSIDWAEAGDYRFLLLAHGRVQHQLSNTQTYLYYQGRKRDLVVWDEALLTTNGESINVDRLLGDIASWKTQYQQKLKDGRTPRRHPEEYQYMFEYLSGVEGVLDQQYVGQIFPIPKFDDEWHEYKRPLRIIMGRGRSINLEKLIEYSGIDGKIILAGSNKAFIRFDVVVPDEVDKIVVLDASAEINLLQGYDKSIQLGDIGDIQKACQNVTIHYAPVKSSRDYLSSVFKADRETNLYLKELGHIVQELIPQTEDFLVFTYKDRDGVQFEGQILEYLDSLGNGYRGRCNVVTWGNERGTNKYSHVKYAITLGVMYRDHSEIAASIIGQNRDLGYQVTNTEIKDVSDSQQADILYQGLSRGNMRHTNKGVAGEMTCWVFHKEEKAIKMLTEAMPNVDVCSYIPVYLSEHGVSDAVSELAGMIVEYLDSVPSGIDKISLRRLAKALGYTKTNSRKWTDAVKKASDGQHEWEKPKGAQSFYRGGELLGFKGLLEPSTHGIPIIKTLLH